MAIYNYTLKKYLKAPSTYVISIISFLIVFVVGAYMPYKQMDSVTTPGDYAKMVITVVSSISLFMSIFTSVFAGFKAATMFKDEVENGTFLVVLSKPISRTRLIIVKWLALQSIILLYTFMVALSFLVGTLIFDKGSSIKNLKALGVGTLSSRIVEISVYIWLLMFLIGFIFSSISLLLSTRMSVGATIGISIGLGLIIPITSMIGMFTKKNDYEKFATFEESLKVTRSKYLMHQYSKLLGSSFKHSSQEIEKMYAPGTRLTKLSVATGKEDTFKHWWLFDLNYQLTRLSEYAYTPIIPDNFKNGLGDTRLVKRGTYKIKDSNINGVDVIKGFNDQIIKSWNTIKPLRELTVVKINKMIKTGGNALIFKNYPNGVKIVTGQTLDSDMRDGAKQKFAELATLNGQLSPGYFDILNNTKFIELLDMAQKTALHPSATNGKTKEYVSAIGYQSLLHTYGLMVHHSSKFGVPIDLSTPEKRIISSQRYHSFRDSINHSVDIIRPLSFWITGKNLKKKIIEKNLHLIDPFQGVAKTDIDKLPTPIMMMTKQFDATDSALYSQMVTIFKNSDNKIAEIETRDYVKKDYILLFYVVLGIILVPLSILSIKSKDFR